MVLSAGFGSRLRPLTDELPKPLVPVGSRPLLSHIVLALAKSGVQRVVINAHRHPEQFDALTRGAPIPVKILRERWLLGTLGGLVSAKSWFETEPIIVCNGDILTDYAIEPLLAAVANGAPALQVARAAQLGSVGVGADSNVARLRGEAFAPVAWEGDYVGVMALEWNHLPKLAKEGCLIGDFILPRLRAKGQVQVVRSESPWQDLGTPQTYLQANINWLEKDVEAGGSWLGEGASLGPGVSIRRSVIGARARVLGVGMLENCVVWPGATAYAPLKNAIVTTRGELVQL